MRVILLLVVLIALFNSAFAGYSCAKPCYGNMCCSIPSDNKYYLTDFCGSTSACGEIPSCTATSYFTADAQRFGCGKYLNICTDSKRCIKAKVIDSGPAMWVEQNAGRAIIDASPSACKDLFKVGSCGWSDHFSITATIAKLDDGFPLDRPFNVTDEQLAQFHITHNEILTKCEEEKACNGFDL